LSATADAYWLALRRVHGAGPRTCRLLLERFGSAEQIFKATEDEIAAAGVGRKVADSIAGFNDFAPLEKELCELPRLGARLVRWTDDEYPANLKQIADPPPYLVARGLLEPRATACVAVVGARPARPGCGWPSGWALNSPRMASSWSADWPAESTARPIAARSKPAAVRSRCWDAVSTSPTRPSIAGSPIRSSSAAAPS